MGKLSLIHIFLLSLMGGPFFLWLLFRQRGGRRT